MRALLPILLTLLTAFPALAVRRRPLTPPALPSCETVSGTAGVTFTRDEGRTIAATTLPRQGIGYTYGLTALDVPHALLAWHRDAIILSTDDGCSWRTVATNTDPDFPPILEPARGGRAYAWSDGRLFLLRYDLDRGATTLKAPGAIVGLGVDASDPDHVRAGTDDGAIWRSLDAGQSFERIGQLELANPLLYHFAFDPKDVDHIVSGSANSGVSVSFDGGKNWSKSTGFDAGSVNAFNIVVSPADGNVVWAMALEVSQGERHIFRSTDGGRHFTPVVNAGNGVTLINGPIMAAHPTNPSVLYFIFGTRFQGYGTDIFRYDAATSALTVQHQNDLDDVNAITFARTDPNVMYLGVEIERGIQ